MEKQVTLKVVEESDLNKFEAKCNELFSQGYILSSTSCGFVNSERYDFCSSYQAIFVHYGV